MTKKTVFIIGGVILLVIATILSGKDIIDEWQVAISALPLLILIFLAGFILLHLIRRSYKLLTKMITTASPAEVMEAIKNGARCNAKNRLGQTPLMLAARFNNPEAVAVLLNAKVDVNATCKRGMTALMYASQAVNPTTIMLLLKAGADIHATDNEGATALLYAVQYSVDPELVAILLSAGADANDKSNNKWSALAYAAYTSIHPGVAKLLCQAGADIHARIRGLSPLMLAANNSYVEVLKFFIEAGAYVNAVDADGDTPLMWAARFNSNPEAIDILLQAGANGTLKNKSGKTAFDYVQDNTHLRDTVAYEILKNAALDID